MRPPRALPFIILTLLTLVLAARIFAADSTLLETYAKGSIDWQQGEIQVVGYGRYDSFLPEFPEAAARRRAIRAARADAWRNALEVAAHVRIHGDTDFGRLIGDGDLPLAAVQQYLSVGRFDEPIFSADGICSVIYRVPLANLAMLLPATGHRRAGKPFATAPDNAPMAPMAPFAYTGIIIDARRTGAQPALYPHIFDNDGYLLYAPAPGTVPADDYDHEPTTAILYSASLEQALTLSRIGNNPLLLRAASAIEAGGGAATDLVLGYRAARAFRAALIQSDIRAKRAVVIVIH